MKIRSISTLMVVLMVIVGFSTVPAFSGDKDADTMQIVREKIKADKKMLVAMNMNLTESEAEKFWPVYEDYQKALEGIRVRFGKLIEGYAANYKKMTDDTAGSLLDDFLAIEVDLLAVRKSYLPKFKEILPAVKVARYYQIENKIMAVVRYDAAANIPLMKNEVPDKQR